MEVVLKQLNDIGFRANFLSSFFMQQEVKYFGFLLTSDGIRPQPKKIEAMTQIKLPTNSKQLKQFLGMVNFYQDVWPRCSHILASLAKLSSKTSKINWLWTKIHQQAFEESKAMLCKHAMLAYPDFEKPFDLYTDASNLQLGATLVVQDGKPIGFYTRKLNSAQQNYTVGKKELLGIVEFFKAFEGILRGTDVTVHTDNMNLLYKSLPSQQMQR